MGWLFQCCECCPHRLVRGSIGAGRDFYGGASGRGDGAYRGLAARPANPDGGPRLRMPSALKAARRGRRHTLCPCVIAPDDQTWTRDSRVRRTGAETYHQEEDDETAVDLDS